jgi:hypothetical protein
MVFAQIESKTYNLIFHCFLFFLFVCPFVFLSLLFFVFSQLFNDDD